LEEEEEFPTRIRGCFVGGVVAEVGVRWGGCSKEGFEEGMCRLVEEGLVAAFVVGVEVVAERGRGDVKEAEPGEGGGPVGVREEGGENGGVGCCTGVGMIAVVMVG
jgi:hypothetical protein